MHRVYNFEGMTLLRPRMHMLTAALLLALAGCNKQPAADEGRRGGGGVPTVVSGRVETHRFADRIQAVGTAYARESTTLASTVTERIVKLHFTDGELVQKGAVIAELMRSQETAGLNEAAARQTEAQQRLDRLLALQKQGFATRASIDEQVAARDAARAQASGAQAQIGDRVIRAPFTGVVGLRRISPGATLTAGAEIATISDVSTIKLDFALPETFLGAMHVGQAIEARAAAYPDSLFHGSIEGIESTVDPVTRSVTVRAVLPNGDRRLRPGMLLTVDVLSNPRDAPAVPELSLIALRDQNFVYKIDADQVAIRVPVLTGAREDGLVEIKRGLAVGQQIVAEGTVKVRDGAKVKPVPAPAGEGR